MGDMRTVKFEVTRQAHLRLADWKNAWEQRLETTMTWAEFLTGLASDKKMWPR
jgi:hypothetical protein